jgi:hypothetical protein
MASIVIVGTSTTPGGTVMGALQQIRDGFATLNELNGLRANAIGTSQAEMATVFGLSSNADAQTLNDRWIAVITDWNTNADAAMNHLHDLIDGITRS